MKKLFILRHGHRLDHADSQMWKEHPRRRENIFDIPLSALGEANSACAGREVRKFMPEVERIYTSPMTRCVRTAEIVANIYEREGGKRPKLHKHYGLAEGISCTKYLGSPIDNVIRDYKTEEETYVDIRAETDNEEIVRVMQTVCGIINKEPKNILIIGHAGTLSFFYHIFIKDTPAPTYKFNRGIDTNKLVGFSIEDNMKKVIYPPNNDFCSF